MHGQITGEGFGKLFSVDYTLEINAQWQVQSFRINMQSDTSFILALHKNKNQQWVNDKDEIQHELDNCTDIDISLTPFTNTLPVKRLNLGINQSKEITVVYIALPANSFKAVKQRYTNLGNGIYKYENLQSGFASNVEFDKDNIVLNYPGIWHRVLPEDEAASRIKETFADALIASKPDTELVDDAKMYNWLIGSWNVEAMDYLGNNKNLHTQGEWHFSWVLEGRAIEDVWIAPKRSLRMTDSSKTANRYGISFRYFDKTKQKWSINWFNPVSGADNKLYGWKEGDKIIQEGLDSDGNLMKWSFEDITPNSFHWKGEYSTDKGKTFTLQAEFFGKRK